MKKIFLLIAGVTMMASSAMAQMSLVKEAEKFVGSNNPQELLTALEKIEPATENPESKDDALTWFTAVRILLSPLSFQNDPILLSCYKFKFYHIFLITTSLSLTRAELRREVPPP